MKKTLNQLSIGIFILFFSGILNAQSGLTLSPDTSITIYSNVDLSNEFEFYRGEVFLGNNSEETLTVDWARFILPDCPEAWELFMFDYNIHYVPTVTESMVPLTLAPQDSMINAGAEIRAHGVAGCCDFYMVFSDHFNPEVKFDTAYFQVRINDDDCLLTSLEEVHSGRLEIFPNPTSDYFSISSFEGFERIEILNANGMAVASHQKNFDNRYDISELGKGFYILNFIEREKLRVSKKLIKL